MYISAKVAKGRTAVRSACMVLTALAAAGCEIAVPQAGVPLALAEQRKADISELSYDLHLTVPAVREERVSGSVVIRFRNGNPKADLVLDFDTDAGEVRSVMSGGKSAKHAVGNGHIVIPASALSGEEEEISVEFVGTDAALNRQEEFLYSLFVPDRAPTAFPCFNQPDLKARYTLTLTVPPEWEAVSNGAVQQLDSTAAARTWTFAQTEPISTYLFAFTAGKFSVEVAQREGRTFRMLHRESDTSRVVRNRDAIFDLHATALEWMEEYTGIAYPYGKFDFVAIPAFQFGGMEHPGAILYRAASLFLEESPTTNQLLGRASLIAHETAHMWFGNLVTMRWFNDVWMKEVFANFMAAKIVTPSFPEINHDLRFLLAHHPAAYEVDRTKGANPIRQPLENLNEAGSLYGAIIYQKAPIVMRQLERLIGEEALRAGLRQYLSQYSSGNASWPDLIAILDSSTDENLAEWSRIWVDEPGRPYITARVLQRDPTSLSEVRVEQSDTRDRGGHSVAWNQRFGVALGYGSESRVAQVHLREAEAGSSDAAGWPVPDFILPGADGVAYGRFALDSDSRKYLLANTPRISDPLVRASAWLVLWEDMLDARVPSRAMIDALLASVEQESDELILQNSLSMLQGTWWRYLGATARDSLAAQVETTLWRELQRAASASRKRALFDAIVSVSLTDAGVARLERIWRMSESVNGLPLGEEQYISLSNALALREVDSAGEILTTQLSRITNGDRKARFQFVMPSLSADERTRDSVFASFADVENRRREAWVLEAQGHLNHPLRAQSAVKYVAPSLELLEEIQRTGDIFFPQRWLAATLGGHQSAGAAEAVTIFLFDRPDYPARLKAKIQQAAHHLGYAGL